VPAFNISMFHSDWNCLIGVDGGAQVVGVASSHWSVWQTWSVSNRRMKRAYGKTYMLLRGLSCCAMDFMVFLMK
jgi:hypothetical protein